MNVVDLIAQLSALPSDTRVFVTYPPVGDDLPLALWTSTDEFEVSSYTEDDGEHTAWIGPLP